MSIDPVMLESHSLDQALALSMEAGWNQVAADWAVFFRHGTVFGTMAKDQLIGTAAALPYGAFGWISMVLVTPAWRNRGVATGLVKACLSHHRDAGRAMLLDATPAGAPVYARLGLRPLGGLQRWAGQGGGQAAASAGVIDPGWDSASFGADRSFLLQDIMAREGSAALTGATGFALLRRGARATQLGPMTAAPEEQAALLDRAVDAARGPVLLDVLDAGHVLLSRLIARGFTLQRDFVRMALGRNALPGRPTRLLVAAGPEFG